MDNLRSIIKALYQDIPYEFCICQHYNFDKENIKKNLLLAHRAYNNQYTDSEHKSIVSYAMDNWMQLHKSNTYGNIFLPLYEFSKEVLIENSCGAKVRFNHLLRWQETTNILGEDIFTTSFLAYKDVYRTNMKRIFDWPLISPHNHFRVNEITQKGIPEMHFHLKGSSANFELNWLCLMNHIDKRESTFRKMNNILSEEKKTTQSQRYYSLYEMCIKAAALRLFFYHLLIGNESEIEAKRNLYTENEASNYIISKIPTEIQYKINTEFCMQHTKSSNCLDYAIHLTPYTDKKETSKTLQEHHSFVSGERKLMYGMFKAIFSNRFTEHPEYNQLFYTYLCIKAKFRKEFIQINRNIGFENFCNYQDRKTLFIKNHTIYEEKLVDYAINGVLAQPEVDYLEARIAPESTFEEMSKTMDYYKKFCPVVDSERTSLCNFTLHFIKQPDNKEYKNFEERHHKLRNKIKRESKVIIATLKLRPGLIEYMKGIDAANTELGCRPEVFAQAYRYLRKEQGLHFTFHAGEDYYDITDGLRAIDEAIHFLNLENGDRIGHALALGIDSQNYYDRKKLTITCSKQDMLDNIVWCYFKSQEYGINLDTRLKAFLKEKTEAIALELGYGKDWFSINCYYSSMQLRGDNPSANQKASLESTLPPYTWDEMNFNFCIKAKNARKNPKAVEMYEQYHYDTDIRNKGRVMCELCFPESYPQLVTALQEAILEEVDQLHICVECNPTSNFRIGGLQKYENHPIFRFHNDGIAKDDEPIHSLSVSINTDDQGVFSTSLPNEYALIAAAMDKKKDKNGKPYYSKSEIYSWLEDVRVSSVGQRFIKKYD